MNTHQAVSAAGGGHDGGAIDGKWQCETGVVVGVLADQVHSARRPPQTIGPATDEVPEALSRHPGRVLGLGASFVWPFVWHGRPRYRGEFWSVPGESLEGMTTLTIECDGCIMQGTDACDDCVVSFICGREPEDAVVFDVAEERALRTLGRGGLVPPIRHHQKVSAPG